MPAYFGTDGIRGRAGEGPLASGFVTRTGAAIAGTLGSDTDHPLVIGRDTRESGPGILQALLSGIAAAGGSAVDAGVLPTPGIARLVGELGATGGVVISASHNPWHDNGIKVFGRDGFKIPVHVEEEIESALDRAGPVEPADPAAAPLPDAAERYIRFCRGTLGTGESLNDLHVVLDCAHGATSAVAPAVFTALGARVSVLNAEPNGRNINEGCGSEHPGAVADAVRAQRAHLGFAFDGDGDRLVAVDEAGTVLTGDHVLAACACALQSQDRLMHNTVVVTPMSNLGLFKALSARGITVLQAPVGDRNVMEMMRANGATLGGEQSGHLIFLDRHTTGDGIVSALQLVHAMLSSSRTLSGLVSIMTPCPQHTLNVDAPRKPPLDSLPAVTQAIADAEQALGEDGRVLVRYSGTQPLCRVMVEAATEEQASTLAEQLANVLRDALGT